MIMKPYLISFVMPSIHDYLFAGEGYVLFFFSPGFVCLVFGECPQADAAA
jgi:hypothetical protein